MKDLFVFAADADAGAVVRAVLERPLSLGIRPITFDVDRHPYRDPGMIVSGPEFARLHKGKYQRVILVWDHCGSGCEKRFDATQSAERIQTRLDTCTWKDCSAAVAIVPELEEWLWRNRPSICSHFQIDATQLEAWAAEFGRQFDRTADSIIREKPKEAFEYVVREKKRRPISPADYGKIAARAGLKSWRDSESFALLVETLRRWFPKEKNGADALL
jgi:hypothetical protein